MLLAHLSKKSENYRNLARNSNRYKIMDNSIIELGESFTLENLLKEAKECDVDEIILPDVFMDGKRTVEVVRQSVEWIRDNGYLGKYKLMAVCHGKGPKEFADTFKELNNIPEIDVIGIPKINSTWMSSRVREAEHIAELTNKEVHLLGCWSSLNELKEISKNSKIRSIDTCLPALLSIYGMDVFDDRNGRTIDLESSEVNIGNYRKIMNNINLLKL
jgi:hypothetical protein